MGLPCVLQDEEPSSGQSENLLANLQERLVQTDQGPVVLGTATSTNTGKVVS